MFDYLLNMNKFAAFLLLLFIGLSGCSGPIEYAIKSNQPANFPTDFYRQASQDNSSHVYKIDSRASKVVVRVRRGGLMAKLGHDHIVASQQLQGFIYLDQTLGRCRADFFAPLATMEVDNLELRAAAGMDTQPTAADIIATGQNMLKSLEVGDFPFAQLHSRDCGNALVDLLVQIDFSLHGVKRSQLLSVNVDQTKTSELLISGEFSVLQSDYGIQPFSIMNGLIRVEDRLDIAFDLIAKAAKKE
jgi:hypothetical protein